MTDMYKEYVDDTKPSLLLLAIVMAISFCCGWHLKGSTRQNVVAHYDIKTGEIESLEVLK